MPAVKSRTSTWTEGGGGLTLSAVWVFWAPLAVSWLLMMLGLPIVNAFVARMPEAKLNLAALGIAVALTFAIESPAIALLTTAVALVRDRASYRVLFQFMAGLAILVTVTMLLLALSPLFDVVVGGLIGAPPEVVDLVRAPLVAMSLFPAAVAYRRFRQGMLVHLGYTRPISHATIVRLVVSVGITVAGWAWGGWSGAAVGGAALGISIVVEAAYAHVVSRAAVRQILDSEPASDVPPLTLPALLRFYWPLAFTSMVWLWAPSLISFGLARAPLPLESLATWPVVSGQLSVLASFGFSYMDPVVALRTDGQAARVLNRFAVLVAAGSTVALLVVAFSPLAGWWQQQLAGLSPELTELAIPALRLGALIPALAVAQSLLRGIVIKEGATGAIAQATIVNLALLALVLLMGATTGWMPGVFLAALALTAARLGESVWLWVRTRSLRPGLGGVAVQG
jgi:hypothetical protein